MNFQYKHKNKRNNLHLDLDKCYLSPEQHSRDFSRRSDILGNANASGAVQLASLITRKVLNENELNYSVLESF